MIKVTHYQGDSACLCVCKIVMYLPFGENDLVNGMVIDNGMADVKLCGCKRYAIRLVTLHYINIIYIISEARIECGRLQSSFFTR